MSIWRALYHVLFIGLLFFSAGCKRDIAFPAEGPVDPTDPKPDPPTQTPYVFNLPNHYPTPYIPVDNPMTVEGVELGRYLFYEELLSGDNTMSCASCHNQEFGFTDNGKQFSSGIDGSVGNRNSMHLANLVFQKEFFFWDGRAATLEEQALIPIQDQREMKESLSNAIMELQATEKYPKMFFAAFGDTIITAPRIGKAIAQFVRSLVSIDSPFDKGFFRKEPGVFLDDDVNRGYDEFIALNGGDCFHCHQVTDRMFGDGKFHNNGLDSAATIFDFPDPGRGGVTGRPEDYGTFKAPSLRNVALTAPYMHDGRFNTLEEVLDHYSEHLKKSPNINKANLQFIDQGGVHLTSDQKNNIISFLKALTDTSFINNPAFSDPEL